MNTIQDAINTLSDKEKEQHSELIKECLQREKELEQLNLSQLCTDFLNLVTLTTLPEDAFYNA